MKLAFYKGKGNLIDKIIRWRTKSVYSHVEIVFNGIKPSLWFSSSPRDGGVRFREIKPDPEHWDYIELGRGTTDAYLAAKAIERKGYDYVGAIFGAGLKTHIENPKRYFCCEAVAYALKDVIKLTAVSSPAELYNEAKKAVETLWRDDFKAPEKTRCDYRVCDSCQ
jgi:hypothetical protein